DDGVLPGEDALDYDLHLGGVAQPLEEVPGHGRRLGVGEPGKIDALIHRAGSHARLQARAVVTAAAVARVGGTQAEQGFLVAAAGAVYGHRHRETPRLLRAG